MASTSSDRRRRRQSGRRQCKGLESSLSAMAGVPHSLLVIDAGSKVPGSAAKGTGPLDVSVNEQRSLDVCWPIILSFLPVPDIMKYATLSSTACRETECDFLWRGALQNDIADTVRSSNNNGIQAITQGLKRDFIAKRRLLCAECRNATRYVFPLLGIRLCPTCEREGKDSRYLLCSKTDAKQMFLLEGRDLEPLRSIQRTSPWVTKNGGLRLFLRSAVESCALQKFGGPGAFEAEQRRRKEETRRSLVRSEYEVRLPRAGLLQKSAANSGESSEPDSDVAPKASEALTSEGDAAEPQSSDRTPLDGPEGSSARVTSDDDSATITSDGHHVQSRRTGHIQMHTRRSTEPPEPLGLSIETKAPFTIHSVAADSFAARVFGVQVGDRLVAVGGRNCAAYKGGWPAIKAALARRPTTLVLERTFHQYQRSALAPSRKVRGLSQRLASSGAISGISTAGVYNAACRFRRECDEGDCMSVQRSFTWQEVDYIAMGVSGLEVQD